MNKLSARGNCVKLGAVLAATTAFSVPALAGGFAVREQSTTLLGTAFAGAAAGVDLSSAFWNPAAFSTAKSGLSSQSSYSVIVSDTEVAGVPTAGGAPIEAPSSTNIDKVGVLGASYAAYRLDDQTVFGVAINSPFGLSTEADNPGFASRYQGYAAQMMTFNVSPTVSYDVTPTLTVAAGLQIEYMQLKLWQAAPVTFTPADSQIASTSVKMDDTASVGVTLGAILRPMQGTTIGVGYRSSITHDLSGKFTFGLLDIKAPVKAKLETPETVTASLVQSLGSNLRAMATVEWSNWSRVDSIAVSGLPGAVLDANWDDGWLFSGGLEYDYDAQWTVRGGAGWERSPIREATQRLVVLPDTDRVWLSAGLTYRYSAATTFDVGYSHVFFDDGDISRGTLTPSPLRFEGSVTNSADILSVGMRTRW